MPHSMIRGDDLAIALGNLDYRAGLLIVADVGALTEQSIRTSFATSHYELVKGNSGAITRVEHGAMAEDHSARTDFFDYHFDGAYLDHFPEACALYCISPGRGDSPTSFVDTRDVLRILERQGISSSTLSGVDWVYRTRGGKLVRRPLLQVHPVSGDETLACSIGGGRLEASMPREIVNAAPDLSLLWSTIKRAVRAAPAKNYAWNATQLIIWDNLTYLHARLAQHPDAGRKLLRFWFRLRQHPEAR